MKNTKSIKRICYTGIGSRNSGNHTRKQFMSIANKSFKQECSEYKKSSKCKSCRKKRQLIKANKGLPNYKDNSKKEKKYMKKYLMLNDLCLKCENKNTKKCNFKDYIKYSGANIGKCKK